MTAENTKEPTGKLKFAYDTIAKLEEQNAALIAEVKSLRGAIEYALPLMSAPPQHRREFYATARAALRKALTTK
jgi:hypothetical protein